MLSRTQVAVVGLGPRGQAHLQAVMAHPAAKLAGVVDHQQTVVASTVARTGARGYRSVEALLDAQPPELAVVAVPPRAHPAVASRLLAAGVAVLLEKPVALTAERAWALAAQAAAAGVVAAAGQVERFNPAFVALGRAVAAGRLGELTLLHAERVGPPPAWAEVGVTLDLAVHDLDLAAAILPNPGALRVAAAAAHGPAGAEHTVHARLWHPAGIQVGLDAAWRPSGRRRRLHVAGHCGGRTADLLPSPTAAAPDRVQAATLAQLDDVLAALREGRAPTVGLAAGAAAVDLAEQIQRAAAAPAASPHALSELARVSASPPSPTTPLVARPSERSG